MSIYLDGMPCSVCNVPIWDEVDKDNLIYMPRIFEPDLRGQWDGVRLHKTCYLGLDVLPRLAGKVLEFVERRVASSVRVSAVLTNEYAFVSFTEGNPNSDKLTVWLRATGTSVDVRLRQWPAWLAAPDESGLHHKERDALKDSLSSLRVALPNAEAVFGRMEDMDAKRERIRAARDARLAERASAEEVRVATVQAQFRDREMQFEQLATRMRTQGIVCPRCTNASTEFRVTPSLRLICPTCGRSSGVEDHPQS